MTNVKKGTDSNFEEMVKAPYVLVQFSAEWCGPCKMLGPVIDEISTQYENINFVKVNVDESTETAIKYNIRGVPTVLLMKDGNIVERFSGFKPKVEIEAKINDILS